MIAALLVEIILVLICWNQSSSQLRVCHLCRYNNWKQTTVWTSRATPRQPDSARINDLPSTQPQHPPSARYIPPTLSGLLEDWEPSDPLSSSESEESLLPSLQISLTSESISNSPEHQNTPEFVWREMSFGALHKTIHPQGMNYGSVGILWAREEGFVDPRATNRVCCNCGRKGPLHCYCNQKPDPRVPRRNHSRRSGNFDKQLSRFSGSNFGDNQRN